MFWFKNLRAQAPKPVHSWRKEANVDGPAVSLGLPVFNGERFLAEALDLILAQTFTDFELIISDNASTDRTADICQSYATRDKRIRYYRNGTNIGAAANFNRTYELARGKYFKWCAHDDLLHAEYLKKCVEAIDADPSAALCNTKIEYIDEFGHVMGIYDTNLVGRDAERPSDRFAALVLRPHSSADFFGLIRRDALNGTMLHGSFHNGDRALLAELSLRGKLLQLPESLIVMRDHPYRYSRSARRPRDRRQWHDPTQSDRVMLPTWCLFKEYTRMVNDWAESREEYLRCYSSLVKWWFCNWNCARMAVDVFSLIMPDVLWHAERLKEKLISPSPGPSMLPPK